MNILHSIMEEFQKGGVMMWPLLAGSVIALAIAIERGVSLKYNKIIKPEIVRLVENVQSPEDIGLAVSICDEHGGPFSNMVKVVLDNWKLPVNDLKEAVSDSARQEARTLDRGLVILDTIAAVSPLLGLLGTVLGMIKVFSVISKSGLGQGAQMATGISEALLTTVAGLVIAIPTLGAHTYFSEKAEDLLLDIENYMSTLIRKVMRFNKEDR